MKKIGILTHYYKVTNYGANLQAYALTKFLNDRGYDAEQICYETAKSIIYDYSLMSKIRKYSYKILYKLPYLIFYKLPRKIIIHFRKKHEETRYNVAERKLEAFKKFNREIIPHSKEAYCFEDLGNTIGDYDVFIVGSDQVWNMTWFIKGFFLGFVPSNKVKLSYAASFGSDGNLADMSDIVKEFLVSFNDISVREKSAVKYLSSLGINSKLACDPVFLLEVKDWDAICSPRLIDRDYVFCYFLGNEIKLRKIAKNFAKKHKLKLVIIPHMDGRIRLHDINFGDERLFDATPEDYISLIKYAKYVFTDSFHTVLFSNIYRTQYFVFNKDKSGDMNTRIFNITELFNQEERFCYGKNQSLKYVEDLSDIDYKRDNSKFEKLKKDSIDFLMKNLGSTDKVNE